MRVLDIGSGIGGPARYIAASCAAGVTALELQPDLDALAADLTKRCGLADLVEHRCGNILDGLGESYDAIVSFLCFLHIADRKRLLAACRAALAMGGGMYIEDFAKRREPTADEAAALEVKVQCPVLPWPVDYEAQLRAAGFVDIHIEDVTSQWSAFTASRLEEFRAARSRNVSVHGLDIVDGLDDFYATVAGLFQTGVIAGLKIRAR
jgi:cyclopropane fatty-acyl-phospholipid synthase-like methyltransferase